MDPPTPHLHAVVLVDLLPEDRRLPPFSPEVPKFMLPICHKPLIFYTLSWLIQAGIKYITVCADAENSARISDVIGSDPQLSVLQETGREEGKAQWHFQLVEVESETSSWNALKQALTGLSPDVPPDVLVVSDDLLVTTDPLTLLEIHQARMSAVTVLLDSRRVAGRVLKVPSEHGITELGAESSDKLVPYALTMPFELTISRHDSTEQQAASAPTGKGKQPRPDPVKRIPPESIQFSYAQPSNGQARIRALRSLQYVEKPVHEGQDDVVNFTTASLLSTLPSAVRQAVSAPPHTSSASVDVFMTNQAPRCALFASHVISALSTIDLGPSPCVFRDVVPLAAHLSTLPRSELISILKLGTPDSRPLNGDVGSWFALGFSLLPSHQLTPERFASSPFLVDFICADVDNSDPTAQSAGATLLHIDSVWALRNANMAVAGGLIGPLQHSNTGALVQCEVPALEQRQYLRASGSFVAENVTLSVNVDIADSIVMRDVTVGENVKITNSVIGSGATIEPGSKLKGVIVAPGRTVPAGTHTGKIIA